MKVAIDIRRVADFGVGTYIRNIVRALGRLDRQTKYIMIGAPQKVREIGPLPPNFHSVTLTAPEVSLRGCLEFRAILRRLGCDLVHIPHLSWLPQYLPCPYVMTVHDVLEHMYRARNHSGLRRSLHFHLTRRVLHGAARIFAVSNFTKKDVEVLFGIPSDNIHVIYNAIDERFRQGHATDVDRQVISERYQVNYPFLLYAGRLSPHKNVGRTIEAFSALKTELEKEGKFPDLFNPWVVGYFGFTTNLTPNGHMISFAASHQGHGTHTDASGTLGLCCPTASTATNQKNSAL